MFIGPLCDTNEAGAKHFTTNFVSKQTKNISVHVCTYSLQYPQQEVLELLVLDLRIIESGCPKGEAQFALQVMFHFPCISNKEAAIWLSFFTCKSPGLISGKRKSYVGAKLNQRYVK